MKYGVEDFLLLSVYFYFYVVTKIILFSFIISMNVNNGTRLLLYVTSNFIMKDILWNNSLF